MGEEEGYGLDTDAVIFALRDLFQQRAEQGITGVLFCLINLTDIAYRLHATYVSRESVREAVRIMVRSGNIVYEEITLPSIEHYAQHNLLTSEEAAYLQRKRREEKLPDAFMPSEGFLLYSLGKSTPLWLDAEHHYVHDIIPGVHSRLRPAVTTLSPRLTLSPVEYRCATCQTSVARSPKREGVVTVDGLIGGLGPKNEGALVYAGKSDEQHREPLHCAACGTNIGVVVGEASSIEHHFDEKRVQEIPVGSSIAL